MNVPPDEPMTPAEQAMGRRLRALRRNDVPSEALDAAVLAAARAAALPATRPGAARTRPRWPAITGIAASCALALGLAWRLFPAHPRIEGRPAATERPNPPVPATPAPARPGPTASPSILPQDAVRDVDTTPVPPPAPKARAHVSSPLVLDTAGANASPSARMDAAATGKVPPPSPPATNPGDLQAPPPVPPAPPAPPPSPPAPPAPPRAAAVSTVVAPAPKMDAANRANESAITTDAAPVAAKASATTQPVPVENGYDARPPATADDASVRDAWLQRIRALLADGKREEARRSLAEYHARFPATPVPDDLRPLLPAQPRK